MKLQRKSFAFYQTLNNTNMLCSLDTVKVVHNVYQLLGQLYQVVGEWGLISVLQSCLLSSNIMFWTCILFGEICLMKPNSKYTSASRSDNYDTERCAMSIKGMKSRLLLFALTIFFEQLLNDSNYTIPSLKSSPLCKGPLILFTGNYVHMAC